MIAKTGFDTKKYLATQVQKILDRVSLFDKLYLEFGGKLCYDNHAARVLPGFELDTKVQMLRQLGNNVEIVHCISAKDIEKRKIRRDFGLAYDDQIIKDITDLRHRGLEVSAVVINRFDEERSAIKFKQKLERRDVPVFIHREIPQYLKNIDLVVSESGYGRQDHVETRKGIVIVTAPGPGSGKMSFCMAQVYNDRNQGINSGFAKFETFPIWNLALNHPVNVAYEAATADIGDYNMVDPFHQKAYGVTAINYNRDIENFAIMRRIIEKIVGENDPLAQYLSPTDMGVNMAKDGIIDDAVVREASKQEIVRRYFRYHREFIEGDTTRETLERMVQIMKKVAVSPEDRSIVMPARAAALDAKIRQEEGKGYRGVFCGAAIEMFDTSGQQLIVTGKNSPLLHAEAAVLLNAVKMIAGIADEIEVISPTVIESMRQLKSAMDLDGTSLHVKEVLDALAASSVTDDNARKCILALKELQGCDIHTTHLMDDENEKPLKQLGLYVTTDAQLPFLNDIHDEEGWLSLHRQFT